MTTSKGVFERRSTQYKYEDPCESPGSAFRAGLECIVAITGGDGLSIGDELHGEPERRGFQRRYARRSETELALNTLKNTKTQLNTLQSSSPLEFGLLCAWSGGKKNTETHT